jgi:CRP-like cAMP-binding protein
MIPDNHHISQFRKGMQQFVLFTDGEWEILSQGLQLQKLKKKACLVESGKVCKKVGFVLSGALRNYHVKDGQEITGYFCIENDWVSAYKSFLTQKPSIITIDALEETELITFTHEQLQIWLKTPELAYKMERFGRLIAEYLICCYEDRVASFILQTPEERYLDLLKNGENILQRIPQHYIANYLGITPVSLSRIRKRILESME